MHKERTLDADVTRRPYEETWFVEDDGPEVEVHRVGGAVCGLNGPHARTEDDVARAKLIAQAPAMARLLLDLEWSGMHWDRAGGTACCPSCGANRGRGGVESEHATSCALATVLRAAGVLP